MVLNIAYAKKHFVCFFQKNIIRNNIFLIAMDDWRFVIVCCLIEDCPKKDRCAKHSWYCKDYHRSLDIFHRQLQQRKIPRCPLQEQSQSAWWCLYKSRNDQGMITLTGFDRAMFDSLCEIFTLWIIHTFCFLWRILNVQKSKIGEGLGWFGRKMA